LIDTKLEHKNKEVYNCVPDYTISDRGLLKLGDVSLVTVTSGSRKVGGARGSTTTNISAAANKRVIEKCRKFEAMAAHKGGVFGAFVMERDTCAADSEARKLLYSIAQSQAGEDASISYYHLRATLAVLLCRRNCNLARMVIDFNKLAETRAGFVAAARANAAAASSSTSSSSSSSSSSAPSSSSSSPSTAAIVTG
jgi:hypothetical protein